MESDNTHAIAMMSRDVSESASEDSSESEPDAFESLYERLQYSMSTSVFERTQGSRFLPRDAFEKVLSSTAAGPSDRRNFVLEVMGVELSRPSEDDRALADYILDSARKVFLVAVDIELEQLHAAMKLFKISQYKDEDLPVEEYSRTRLKVALRQNHHPFQRMETVQRKLRGQDEEKNRRRIWSLPTIARFQDSQWIFLAPTMSTLDLNSNFDHRCPIPFITKDSRQSSGSYGIVYKYTIHHAHFKNTFHQVIQIMAHAGLGFAG